METLTLVDEIRDRLSDGDYLNLMNALKRDYDLIQEEMLEKENTIKELRRDLRRRKPRKAGSSVPFAPQPPVPPRAFVPVVIAEPTEVISKRYRGKTIMGRVVSETDIEWENGENTTHTPRSMRMLRLNHSRRVIAIDFINSMSEPINII